MIKIDELTSEFSFELPDWRELTAFQVVSAAADVMRDEPFFQQKRKDGGLYKRPKMARWMYWGAPETVISGMTNHWAVIITPAGHRRFNVRAFKSHAVHGGSCQSFRAIERKAA